MRSSDPDVLFAEAVAGERASVGRLLSLVERGGDRAGRVAALTYASSAGIDAVIGVTGAPGAGKSTLTDALVREARRAGRRVGVLAVDPSSPLTNGAILGDRVRMQDHASDPDVFIRSMATRGHLGGLSLAVPEAIRVLGAVGYPTVVVETVGVGQVEVDIAGAADTTVVVVTPGWGDSIQASKAGLLEVADLYVVNKADRPGATAARRDLEAMLDLDPSMGEWRPPVLPVTATTGEGVAALWDRIEAHGAYLQVSGERDRRRQRRLVEELERIVLRRLSADVRSLGGGRAWEEARAAVLARTADPRAAATQLVAALGLGASRT